MNHMSKKMNHSSLPISSKHITLILFLILSITSQARSIEQQHSSQTEEKMQCALYQVATQDLNEEHTIQLHCENDKGLSYELLDPAGQVKQQFQQISDAIDQKLTDIVTQLTGLDLKQKSRINTAKMRLRHQLKGLAQPQLKLSDYKLTSDQIIFTDKTVWSIFQDVENIEQEIEALNVANQFQLQAASGGVNERTALVIHVTANDFSMVDTPAELGDSVFGTDGDPVNLVSQYDDCSYGQMKLMPASGQHITNGVVEISIDMDVEGERRGTVRNAVVAAANDLFGSLSSQADHFIFALPPNTTNNSGDGWIAYASINGTYSTYNNRWATYVSAQMHELGHNFGMGHSGRGGNEYNDKSGMMGFSYSSDNGPLMCFNAVKNTKFGWYEDKELTFFESDWTTTQNSWRGQMVGVANYDEATDDQNVIIKIHSIEGDVSSPSIHFNYNRKTGINSGTKADGNRLSIAAVDFPTGYNTSLVTGVLDAGESTIFESFWGNEKDLIVTVLEFVTDNNDVMYADVEIKVDFNLDDLIFTDGFEL